MKQISEHITFAESFKSQAAERFGINNIPPDGVIPAMILVANKCFEPIRAHFGIPIGVSSFYRCNALNTKIKGAKNSQHIKGEAIDIDADIFGGVTNSEIFHWAKENIIFDQLLWEFGNDENPAWVHISYSISGNRNQIIKIK